MQTYSISGVSVKVACEDPALAEKVRGAMNDFFYERGDVPVAGRPDISVEFKSDHSSFKVPDAALEFAASPCLNIFRDRDFYYLKREDSVSQLDLSRSIGTVRTGASFWGKTAKSRQEFLMLSLLWLLHRHGLYALHANGLVKDNSGILLVGSSGSGKSTSSLSLIRQGWNYLSDDVVLLKESPDGIESIAFQKGISFGPNLAGHYPELDRYGKPSMNGQKKFLDIKSVYPDGFVYSSFPKVLIFPEVTQHKNSVLSPVAGAEALIMLIKNSGGIMVDKKTTGKQIEVLKQLISQVNSYRLFLGHDLHERPDRISGILAGLEDDTRDKAVN
ncbi:MAG: hypothetical protein C4560_09970 [Nitrospiraceae bacterium]|nr:MAG: hypothetical protein C4560_09970 [Nitrospiraceae bacterium]